MWRDSVRTFLVVVAMLALSSTAMPQTVVTGGSGRPGESPAVSQDALPDCTRDDAADAQVSGAAKVLAAAARVPCPGGNADTCLAEVPSPVSSLASEVRFVGDWQPDQVDLMLSALARYERVAGETRLRQLLQTALHLRNRNWSQLCFVRAGNMGTPVAFWAPAHGVIVLNNGLFDTKFVEETYNWVAFFAWDDTAAEPVTIQDAIIAHEIGHLIVDALQGEQQAKDPDGPALETLYRRYVDPQYWPHADSPVDENLATEFALLSLGITRPGGVFLFRQYVMLPSLAGTYWTASDAAWAGSNVLKGAR